MTPSGWSLIVHAWTMAMIGVAICGVIAVTGEALKEWVHHIRCHWAAKRRRRRRIKQVDRRTIERLDKAA